MFSLAGGAAGFVHPGGGVGERPVTGGIGEEPLATRAGRCQAATPNRQRTMTCREFLDRYSDYDDSLIHASEADRFRQHMDRCPSCARYDRVLRKGRMLARQLPPPEPSPDFIPRLRLRLLRQRPRRTRSPSARLAAGLAAVTVLLAAVSAVRVVGSSPGADAALDQGVETAVRTPVHRGVDRPARETQAGAAIRLAARPSLPVLPGGAPRAWPVTEVASSGAASYSPLETGPPAYRVRPASPRFSDPDRRALD